MKKNERIFFIIIVSIVTLLHLFAYRIWLFSSGILTQGDWMLSLPNYSKSLLSLPIIWKSYSMGSIDLTPPFYIFLLLQGLLSNLNIGYGFIERITFMWPIVLFTIPFTYLFIRSFTKNAIGAFVGALVYTYNTYFLILQSGQLTLMAAFTFAPLVLLCLKNAMERRSLFYSVLTGLFAFVVSFFEFRLFYLVALISLFYYLYYLFFIAQTEIRKTFKQTIVYTVLPLFIVILLNIYWILPYVFATVSINGAIFNRDLFGKELFNISRGITLFHPFWTGDKYFPFITQPIPFYFFLTPIAAILGLYLNRKNKHVLFYGLLAIIGVFLVKQNNAPFPDVYVWLYTHFPGFGAFREASKFYFFVALGYSVLMGVFIDWIWANWRKTFFSVGRYLIIILIVGLNVWNIKTLMVGSYGTLFVNRVMPTAYSEVNDYIDNQDIFFRTFWVPTASRWGTISDLHPREGTAETLSGAWKSLSDATKYSSLGDQFITFFKLPHDDQLLNLASIKYVIVPLADSGNDDDFFPLFGKSRTEYIKTLNTMHYLHKITMPQTQIAVYENYQYRPHLYTTQEKESLAKNISFQATPYTKFTNSQYQLTFKNIRKPFYIQFTESYHPDWRLRVGDFHWYGLIGDRDGYFLPKNLHGKNVAGFNSFYIDPQEIKNDLPKSQYKINDDGSIDLDMTLYFAPQTYSYIGIFISGLALLVILVYIFLYRYKIHENRHQ